jgi:hypothetical protein
LSCWARLSGPVRCGAATARTTTPGCVTRDLVLSSSGTRFPARRWSSRRLHHANQPEACSISAATTTFFAHSFGLARHGRGPADRHPAWRSPQTAPSRRTTGREVVRRPLFAPNRSHHNHEWPVFGVFRNLGHAEPGNPYRSETGSLPVSGLFGSYRRLPGDKAAHGGSSTSGRGSRPGLRVLAGPVRPMWRLCRADQSRGALRTSRKYRKACYSVYIGTFVTGRPRFMPTDQTSGA